MKTRFFSLTVFLEVICKSITPALKCEDTTEDEASHFKLVNGKAVTNLTTACSDIHDIHQIRMRVDFLTGISARNYRKLNFTASNL